MHLELERIVPTGHVVLPFVWATGEEHATFEASVRDHPTVKELLVLDTLDDSALYRIEWVGAPTDLIQGFAAADAVVLDARGENRWEFRLRFPDHDALSSFHNFVIEHGIDVHIERTDTLTGTTEHGHRFGLSQEQREALVLACSVATSRRRARRASRNSPTNWGSAGRPSPIDFGGATRRCSTRHCCPRRPTSNNTHPKSRVTDRAGSSTESPDHRPHVPRGNPGEGTGPKRIDAVHHSLAGEHRRTVVRYLRDRESVTAADGVEYDRSGANRRSAQK